MKKGYKRLLIYEFIICLILILNSFVSSILNDYILIFKVCFGFEKDKHRYIKDIIMEIIINLIIFFLLYYLFGLIIGFAKTDNYFSLNSIIKFIIPIFLIVVVKEFLRYMILVKSEGCKLLTYTTCVMFVLIDITSAIYYSKFGSNVDNFMFFALTLLPAISTNIVCTYITQKTGYKPVIVYLLVTNLYRYLLPIVPNPNIYLVAVIDLLLPVFIGFRVYRFYLKDYDKEVERKENKSSFIGLAIPTLLIIFLVYITSGYFHYYAIAIASGSMEPEISKGDVAIVEKIDDDYSKLKVGQVIAYNYDNIIVVHRLVRIVKIGDEYFYYSKGDANISDDDYLIEGNMIIGIVKHKVPYVGIPTVWLNEL